jgi:hypothetical protein
MRSNGPAEEVFAARFPVGPMCSGVLAFLQNTSTFLLPMTAEMEEAAASAMTHVYDCNGCRHRLAGLRRRN